MTWPGDFSPPFRTHLGQDNSVFGTEPYLLSSCILQVGIDIWYREGLLWGWELLLFYLSHWVFNYIGPVPHFSRGIAVSTVQATQWVQWLLIIVTLTVTHKSHLTNYHCNWMRNALQYQLDQSSSPWGPEATADRVKTKLTSSCVKRVSVHINKALSRG